VLPLPLVGSWGGSGANAILIEGTTMTIVGWGLNSATGGTEALTWTRQIPAPGALALFGITALAASRRRR